MAYVDIVTALAILQFIVFGYKVARARGRYGIKAPATAGNEIFERHFRVQQNTLEQLVLFLPALWLCALTIGDPWAGLIGLVWPVGRLLYAWGYYRDAEKRGPGFALTAASTIVLLVGAVIGIARAALAGA